MTLEEIKESLGTEKAEVFTAVESLISNVKETEAKIHAAAKSKVNKEAEGLRAKLKRVLDINGYKEGDVEDFIETLSTKKEDNGNEKTALQRQLESIQKQLDSERKEKQSIAEKNKQRTIESKLKDALKDVVGSSYVIKALMADKQVDVDEAENVVFKYGDEVLDLESGVKKFLSSNPDLVIVSSRGGANGIKPQPPAGKKTISRSDFDALPSADRMGKIKEGFTIT